MANGYNAYANIMQPSPLSIAGRNARTRRDSSLDASVRKGELKDEFLDERDAAYEKLKKESEGGFFSNPLAKMFAGFIPGMKEIMMLDTFYRGDKLKSTIDKLPGFERFKGTFLGDSAREQKNIFEDMKMDTKDVILPGITDYVGGRIMGKATEELPGMLKEEFKDFGVKDIWSSEDSGFFEKLFETGKKSFEIPKKLSEVGGEIADKYQQEALSKEKLLQALNMMGQNNKGQAKW